MTARGCANRGSLYDYPVLSLSICRKKSQSTIESAV